MAALLHDAPEACTGIDAPAPVKARILIDTGDDIISLRELEDRLGRTIFRKYGVEQFLHHPLIKECDRAICRLEMEDGCERYDAPSNYPRSLSHTFIPIMEAQCVENWFLNMFATLENDLVEQST